MIGNIPRLTCEKTYKVQSAQNEIRNPLEVICAGEFDDDSPLLAPLGDGHARIVGVG